MAVAGDVAPYGGGSPERKVRIGSVGRNVLAGSASMVRCGHSPYADPLSEKSLILNWNIPRYFPWLAGAEDDEALAVFGRPEGVHHTAG